MNKQSGLNNYKKHSILSGSAMYTNADLTFPSNTNMEEFTLIENRSSYTHSARLKTDPDDFNDDELAVPEE